MWFARISSLLLVIGWIYPVAAALREPVHPRRNVEEFAPVEAKFVRFTVRATNRGEPCLDELEIYSADGESRNVALAKNGARATASGSLAGYAIHQLEGVNDGRYGNGLSWIADRIDGAWVQIELPQFTRINKVIWGRDREGNFMDRLATQYEVQVSADARSWRTVASSADREPLPVGAQLFSGSGIARSIVNRFAPVGTALSADSRSSPTEYRIDVWQTPDGLPGNTVTAIQQTPDGYLWIGTLNGLARFDGLRFQVFGEASALPNTRVLCLLAARDGSLWIGTDGGGLVRFRDGAFQALTRKDGLASDTVTSLAEPKPKQPGILSLRTPVRVYGSFRNPDYELDKGQLMLRAGGAIALALVNPLAALLPLIETGPGTDTDCARLLAPVRGATQQARATGSAPPRAAAQAVAGK